jgi:hypothetical protein
MTRTLDQLWSETFRHTKMNAPFYRESLRGLSDITSLAPQRVIVSVCLLLKGVSILSWEVSNTL